jgi:RNA polymerase sigma factor (sigma-70 family)
MPPDDSGEALFLAQLECIDRVIAFVCANNRLTRDAAEDFAAHVKLKFIENDYAILRRFEGRSKLRTYLTVVTQRLFLDYRIAAWGRWRPSAEARRAGQVGILLEQLLVRDGYSFDEARELLRAKHGIEATRDELERLLARLPVRARRRFDSDDELTDMPSSDRPPDDLIAERDRRLLASRLSTALSHVMASLDTESQLILALRFEDGRTLADIATLLRLDQKALYRRMDRLLERLREALENDGVTASAVLELLDNPAAEIGPSLSRGAR